MAKAKPPAVELVPATSTEPASIPVSVTSVPFFTETMKNAIITGFFAAVMAYLNYRTQAVMEAASNKAHKAAEDVKQTLEVTTADAVSKAEIRDEKIDTIAAKSSARDEKIEEIASATEKIHVLTNNNFGVSLQVSAMALRRVAELTEDPADIAAAEMAEAAFAEHQANQAIVDAKDPEAAAKQKVKPKPKVKPKAKTGGAEFQPETAA